MSIAAWGLIKEYGCQAGLVLNPATPVNYSGKRFWINWWRVADVGQPGFGGQSFIPNTLENPQSARDVGRVRMQSKRPPYRIGSRWRCEDRQYCKKVQRQVRTVCGRFRRFLAKPDYKAVIDENAPPVGANRVTKPEDILSFETLE